MAGLDFSSAEDQYLLGKEWDEINDDLRAWKNIKEQSLSDEFLYVDHRIMVLAKAFENLSYDLEIDELKNEMKLVLEQQLSSACWIVQFKRTNRDDFPNIVPAPAASKPSFYGTLTPEEKKQYDMVFNYHQEALLYENVSDYVAMMLRKLPLDDSFKLFMIKENFEDAQFNKSFYDKVNADLQSISDRLEQDWYFFEKRAKRSQDYVDKYAGKISKDKFKTGYRKERLKDYLDDVKNCTFYSNLQSRSDGVFECKPDVYARASAVDDYTYELSRIKGLDEKLQKSIDECVKLRNKDILPAEKYSKTIPGKSVFSALDELVKEVQGYLEEALTEYNLFKNCDSNAPYCFMKKLPGYASMSSKYGFSSQPYTDPWDMGTFYINIYSYGRTALEKHCKEFVEEHGYEIKN
ncbi:MAG: hypothetical protein J5585_11095 [Clostridia bacterium]|nr:hypothetical protein [Clostridia bacterium]